MSITEAELRAFLEGQQESVPAAQAVSESDVRAFLDAGAPNPAVAEAFTASHAPRAGREPAPEYSHAHIDRERAHNFVRALREGATLNTGRYASAAAQALPALIPGGESYSDRFRSELDEERAGIEQFREESPAGSLATEIAGGFLTGAGLGKTLMQGATGLPGMMARGGALGAGAGGVAAAAEAEGGLDERVQAARAGGGVGAALGFLAPAAGATAGRLGTAVADVAEGVPGVRLRSRAAAAGQDIINSPRTRGDQQIRTALERDRVDFEELARQAEAARSGGTAETVLDLAGENTRGLGRAVAGVPGESKTALPSFLADRVELGQDARIMRSLEGALGRENASAIRTSQRLMSERAANARPLYEEAYKHSVPRSILGDILEDDDFRRAYEAGRTLARREGVNIPELPDVQSRMRAGFRSVGASGDVLEEALPAAEIPVQALDYMKRGLDEVIDRGMRGGTMGRTAARSLRNKLRETLEAVDEAVPVFGQARSAYAGDSAMIEALEGGQDVLRRSPEEIADALADMTEAEADMFRLGALNAVSERLGRQSTNLNSAREFLKPNRLNQLRALFPDEEAFEEFAETLAREDRFVRTRQAVTAGSRTTPMAIEAGDLAGQAVSDATRAVTSPRSFLAELAARGYNTAARGVTESTANEIGPRLTAQGDDLVQLIEELRTLQRPGPRRAPPLSGLLFGTGAAVGTATSRDDRRESR